LAGKTFGAVITENLGQKGLCRVSVNRLGMVRGGDEGQLSAKVRLVEKSLAIWPSGARQPIDNQTSREKNSS